MYIKNLDTGTLFTFNNGHGATEEVPVCEARGMGVWRVVGHMYGKFALAFPKDQRWFLPTRNDQQDYPVTALPAWALDPPKRTVAGMATGQLFTLCPKGDGFVYAQGAMGTEARGVRKDGVLVLMEGMSCVRQPPLAADLVVYPVDR